MDSEIVILLVIGAFVAGLWLSGCSGCGGKDSTTAAARAAGAEVVGRAQTLYPGIFR